MRRVNERAAGLGFHSLRAVHANAQVALDELLPPGAIDRIFVNFPDPWFKHRHRKRRLMSPEAARTLAAALRPGGELFFQSDVFDLALDAMAVLEEEPALHNDLGPWSFLRQNPYGARSRRERRVAQRCLPIWRMRYRRNDLT